MNVIDLRHSTSDLPRPGPHDEPVDDVRSIIERVRKGGDAALIELTAEFDKVVLEDLRVDPDEIRKAARAVPGDLLSALEQVAERIRSFAEHQRLQSWTTEIAGASVGEIVNPVRRAGLYVPGGRAAYPSSVLMCAIPAAVAGVGEVALCVPAGPDGLPPAATLAAASVVGVDEVYRVGGAQAIAALAYGSESIPAVDVIVGPGNIYVALAKREVAGFVGIDSVAGPSEIAIVADAQASPRVVASDVIAQAEHGPGGAFPVVSWDEDLIPAVVRAIEQILVEIDALPVLREAVEAGFSGALVRDLDQAVNLVNRFAPEHLELIFEGAEAAAVRFTDAGATFIGPWSPVPAGDYATGTNHVLPTGGAARWASGLRTSHFQKTTSVIAHTEQSLRSSVGLIETLASAEGLDNHTRAAAERLRS